MGLLVKEERVYRKGEKVFKRLERRLKSEHRGQVIAIEPSTGRYVLGRDALETALKAKERFPGLVVDFFRIGFPAVHKFRRRAS